MKKSAVLLSGIDKRCASFDLKIDILCPSRLNFRRWLHVCATALVLWHSHIGEVWSQVTFEEVERAISRLEAEAIPANSIQTNSGGTSHNEVHEGVQQVAYETTLPPISVTPETGFSGGVLGGMGDVEFPQILEGQYCPTSLPDITEGAEDLTDDLRSAQAKMSDFARVFGSLEDRNAALVANRDEAECPADFVADLGALRSELAGFELMSDIQFAESFSACAQARVQALNDRMVALQSSIDPNAGADRLAVGQLLARMAVVDGEISRGVGTYVFFEQRRGRLETAVGAILRRCQILSGY